MSPTDPIRFTCDSCGQSIKVPAEKAGKRGKCPACKEPITVPEPELNLADAIEEPSWIDALPEAESTKHSSDERSRPAIAKTTAWWDVVRADLWCAFACGVVALVWIGFLATALFGIDLLRRPHAYQEASDKPTAWGMFIFALSFTVVLLPFAVFRFVRTRRLLSFGVEVPFDVVKYGRYRSDMQDVTLEYLVNGKNFRKKLTIDADWAENGFRLLIDPEYPKRVLARPLN